MKVGIILIGLQVCSCIGGFIAGAPHPFGIASWLGYHFMGILGTILLVTVARRKSKRKKLLSQEISMENISEDIYGTCSFIRFEKTDRELRQYLKDLIQKKEITEEQGKKLFYEPVKNINMKF